MRLNRPIFVLLLFALLLSIAAIGLKPPDSLKASPAVPSENPASIPLAEVSHLAGRFAGATTRDNYMYLVSQQRLEIFDIQNPARFAPVGTLLLPEKGHRITLVHNHAYITADRAEEEDPLAYIVDISTPAQPELVGTTDIPINQVSGTYAYSSKGGLQILRTDTVPATVVGKYEIDWGNEGAINILGQYAYVDRFIYQHGKASFWLRQVNIIDISNPTAPKEVGVLKGVNFGTLIMQGNYGYYTPTPSNSNSLIVADFSNPLQPKTVATQGFEQFFAQMIAVEGSHAIVSTGDTLHIIDVSTPSQLETVATYRLPDYGRSALVGQSGTTLYLQAESYIHVLDIQNPVQPRALGTHYALGEIVEVTLAGNHAYALNSKGFFFIIDMADPENMHIIGVQNLDVYLQSATDFEVVGDYVYISSLPQLSILDISDPGAPVKVGDTRIESAHKLVLVGNILYAVPEEYWASRGIQLFDLSDPANPRTLDFLQTEFPAAGLVVKGKYAYLLAGIPLTLTTYDVSDPAAPKQLSVTALQSEETPRKNFGDQIIAGENHLYYGGYRLLWGEDEAGNKDGVNVLSLSNPTAPTYITNLMEPYTEISASTISDIKIFDHFLYVIQPEEAGNNEMRLTVYDISDPLKPVEVAHDPASAHAFEVAVSEDYIFVASETNEMRLLRNVGLSRTVTPETGALLVYPDAGQPLTTVQIPAQAVSDTLTLTYQPLLTHRASGGETTTGHGFLLKVYQNETFLPDFTFRQPFSVTLHYQERMLTTVTDEEQLQLSWHDGKQWRDATASCPATSKVASDTVTRDLEENRLTIRICQGGRFLLVGPTTQVYLPLTSANPPAR